MRIMVLKELVKKRPWGMSLIDMGKAELVNWPTSYVLESSEGYDNKFFFLIISG